MPKKGASPSRFVESEATAPRARFLYMGAFQLAKRQEELSNPKPKPRSGSKSSYRK